MNGQIIPVGELFSQTWAQYKQRALPILAVVLISTVLVGGLIMVMVLCGMFGGVILSHFMDKTTGIYIIVALSTILLLIITILTIWCQAAMLAIVIDEDTGIIEAFQQGWEYLWPLIWVVSILSGILMTGFAFGILPGFLFLTWFSFCVFILFEEGHRGMDTLLISREYVRGHGWNIFGKMAIIWLLSALASMIPFLGQILSILFTPFFLLYLLIMYRDLKAIKGTVVLEDTSGSRVFWWAVTGIGLLLPIIALGYLVFFLFTGMQHSMAPGLDSMRGPIL